MKNVQSTNHTLSFVNYVVSVIEATGTEKIKASIGDSISNNRTLTVNQVYRYLRKSRSPRRKLAARRLNKLKARFASNMNLLRSGRTDAYDISELIRAVANNPTV